METVTPIKAIRAKCLDCTCQQPKEVRECPVNKCPLWPYRMGKRPQAEHSNKFDVQEEELCMVDET